MITGRLIILIPPDLLRLDCCTHFFLSSLFPVIPSLLYSSSLGPVNAAIL